MNYWSMLLATYWDIESASIWRKKVRVGMGRGELGKRIGKATEAVRGRYVSELCQLKKGQTSNLLIQSVNKNIFNTRSSQAQVGI